MFLPKTVPLSTRPETLRENSSVIPCEPVPLRKLSYNSISCKTKFCFPPLIGSRTLPLFLLYCNFHQPLKIFNLLTYLLLYEISISNGLIFTYIRLHVLSRLTFGQYTLRVILLCLHSVSDHLYQEKLFP